MLGFFYAFCAAFFASTSDAFCKKALERFPAVLVAWARLVFASPFLLCLLFRVEGPAPDRVFWLLLLLLLPLESLALVLYMRAIQISPLSLTVPFLSMTPVFTLATSLILLGEFPDASGVAGVLCIVAGAYLLNVNLSRQGLLEPLRAVGREKGSLMMLVVAFLYSITSNLGKLAIQHASPTWMAAVYVPFLAVGFLPVCVRAGVRLSSLRAGIPVFLLIGLTQAVMAVFHFQAISMILVPYMVSVKRLSVLLSVIYGAVFFHERQMRERLLGSLVMVLGVLLMLV